MSRYHRETMAALVFVPTTLPVADRVILLALEEIYVAYILGTKPVRVLQTLLG
jgi:hypothetical protein